MAQFKNNSWKSWNNCIYLANTECITTTAKSLKRNEVTVCEYWQNSQSYIKAYLLKTFHPIFSTQKSQGMGKSVINWHASTSSQCKI